ncbi:MAG TPA: hypothetical protein VJ736_11950 [Actinomycetota bacterium]|jgi:hypothetical protein|nr:hypothetical protein [Actinomycetota bacterium]
MRKLFGVTALATLAVAIPFGAQPASANGHSTSCTGTLDPGTYHRLVVPEGAVCLSEGPVRIVAGLWVQSGATFVLGSEESPGSTGTISGGVHATDAASVQIHFATINGGLEIHGGSGPFGPPFDVTWNAIEDNWIHGGVRITGYDGFWMGFIRNHVSGSVSLSNNTLTDPDGNEYVTNTIHGTMRCWGNDPAPQVGDSEGSPNVVTGRKTGQCSAV